jgi:Ni/Co efflux regulator RcnB
MRSRSWLVFGLSAMLVLSGQALADEHEHGHGNGKHHDRDDDRDDHRDNDREHHGRSHYNDHDRDEMRGWYRDQGDRLPPGLAKRDRLPPGLERQLRVHGTLPPGLRRRMMPCPVELERRLPPPPAGYGHFAVGGHLVLVNRSNFMVLDIFHFEQ